MTDAAVTAFARGCRDLRRLCLRGVVGVPPPLGAPGIVSVCCHCRQLEYLDLGEVWGLEDSALVGFHDHQMEKLEKVSEEVLFSQFTFTSRAGEAVSKRIGSAVPDRHSCSAWSLQLGRLKTYAVYGVCLAIAKRSSIVKTPNAGTFTIVWLP